MLIGIDANEANLTQNRVGINQYAFYLLNALHKLKSIHSFEIYLKNSPLSDLPEERSNWHYRVIPFPKFWTQTRLPLDLYFHRPRPNVFLSLTHYTPRFSPIPTIISVMDLGFLSAREQFTPKDYGQLKSWTSYSVRKATKIIAISEYTKKDIVNAYNRNPENVIVTPLAYDKNIFKSVKDTELANTVLAKYKVQKPFILFLGSLKPNKNIEGLIAAFSELVHDPEYSKLQLVIVGKKAWLYESIFWKVKELDLESKVVFTDFIPEREVPIFMSSSIAFVLPSLHEGFGIPVLEAMACGTPVVISDVSSLPEVGGDAAIYVNPASRDSLIKGIKTALSQREKFVKAGLARVKLFSWNQTAKKTLSVIESIFSNH